MDIVERLRRYHEIYDGCGAGKFLINPDGNEAADEIERLRERIYNLTLLVDAREDWEA